MHFHGEHVPAFEQEGGWQRGGEEAGFIRVWNAGLRESSVGGADCEILARHCDSIQVNSSAVVPEKFQRETARGVHIRDRECAAEIGRGPGGAAPDIGGFRAVAAEDAGIAVAEFRSSGGPCRVIVAP